MKNAKVIVSLLVLVLLVGLGAWAYYHSGFSFAKFQEQLRFVDWVKIGIALGCIYLAYAVRAARWALLLRHTKKVGLFSLTGTQVIGFTAVAIVGRVADPVRPYLVSKKTGLTVSSQIAVYIVDRLFDMGSMALVFSIAALWIPQSDILKAMSHSKSVSALAQHSPFLASAAARFGGLVLTLLGAIFLVAVRMSGEVVPKSCGALFGLISKDLGHAVADKIRTFRSGLDTMRSFSDFAVAASVSLTMWALITFAYLEVCRAFTASSELATMTLPKCVLLMIASGGASIIQLPIMGWFTQIGIVAWTLSLSAVVGSSAEASTACAAMLLVITFLGIIPVGLIWAQVEHVSLRKVAAESGHAAEVISPENEPELKEPSKA